MADPFVRPDVRAFLDYLNASPAPKMETVTPAEARGMMRALGTLADIPPADLAVISDISLPGPGGPLPARLYDARANREPGPVMVFFHGGGFVIGDLETHHPYCSHAALALDLPIVAIDYRMAPEHPWPAAADDCEAAARWVAAAGNLPDRTATSLVLSGDSAGGALTAVTAMALRDAPAAVPVIAQFPLYPVVHMGRAYPSTAEFGKGYMLTKKQMAWFNTHNQPDPDHVRASPLAGDMAGLPPALVLGAGLDPLRDQARAYAAALIEAGVPTQYREAVGNIHGFINLAKAIPSSQGDIASALAVLKPLIAEAEANRVMAQAGGAA